MTAGEKSGNGSQKIGGAIIAHFSLMSPPSLINRLRPFQALQLARRASEQAAYYRAVVFA